MMPPPPSSAAVRPLILIPSYNTGRARLRQTVKEALETGYPVAVVIDGSTDGSDGQLESAQGHPAQLQVHRRTHNGGKGAAVRDGLRLARAAGYTHVLTMDADGQHAAEAVPDLLAAARQHPGAVVMGRPIFGPEAPWVRLKGRRITLALTDFETLCSGWGDTLFGLRVYPVDALCAVLERMRWGKGYDFDPEVAVRLCWQGLRPVQCPATCRYVAKEAGGISHFHYLRDNLKMVWLHTRLLTEFFLVRFWVLLFRGRRSVAQSVGMVLFLWGSAGAVVDGRAEPSLPPVVDPSPSPLVGAAAGGWDAAWQDVFTAMRAMPRVRAQFSEVRSMTIRKHDILLSGQILYDRDRGLCLVYEQPTARVIVIDQRGLLVRDATGAVDDRVLPPQAAEIPTALLHAFAMDPEALRERFTLEGSRSGADWTPELRPVEDRLARMMRPIRLRGTGAVVRGIDLVQSPSSRVEITLSAHAFPETWTPAEAAWFRPQP